MILVKKLHSDCLTEREVTLPTHHKAQLTETAMPWVAVWSLMREGILPVARQILAMLDFYVRKDHELPNADMPLTPEEEEELTPIISALTIAAVQSEQMRTNVLAATLARVAREPGLSDLLELPAAVQWELANHNRRKDEAPGTYAMDIWGTDQTGVPYVFGPPTAENLSRAAELALHQVQARRSAGRPPHPAHRELAERFGPIFTASGVPISRSRSEIVRRERREKVLRSMEGGPFCDFLTLVLPPFQRFLQERRLAPVTVDSIVRLAMAHASDRVRLYPIAPDCSHEVSALGSD
ncbi:hypothetical protein IVB41_09790 [Bradyrhizobium sp. 44]|uniref:hypothetical protein n=1 Tax=Bradyrhizobium sp. 44 TaxID=2782675 RepID=UPI001FF72024|nr:hypothetical protein [Bradyrhizobium sp. 44]MCK1284223.1 hypothetical protein [Bradyrhizobium sp. 44]